MRCRKRRRNPRERLWYRLKYRKGGSRVVRNMRNKREAKRLIKLLGIKKYSLRKLHWGML